MIRDNVEDDEVGGERYLGESIPVDILLVDLDICMYVVYLIR